jgi:hypothetical protein
MYAPGKDKFLKFSIPPIPQLMKAGLLLYVLIFSIALPAQDSTQVTIKAGNKINDVLSPADLFYYPQFMPGKVFFRDGSKAASQMNYNRLSQQMLFISPQGDTLALADEKTIRHIAINKDTFYFDEGYMRHITGNHEIKLAERQVWMVADVRKIGTHNKPTNTFAITSFSTFTDLNGYTHNLTLNEDIILKKETYYFFGDQFNHFDRANRKNLQLLFSKEHRRLEGYLSDNKINFEKKDDLEQLTRFLMQQ